ncbi:hypothetical protein ACFQ60_12330 [Streptomyces zhihengii]
MDGARARRQESSAAAGATAEWPKRTEQRTEEYGAGVPSGALAVRVIAQPRTPTPAASSDSRTRAVSGAAMSWSEPAGSGTGTERTSAPMPRSEAAASPSDRAPKSCRWCST